ncbi:MULTISPECIES: pyrroline-5-carboxylate reductase [Bacillaceae]|jgi:pyrroline-5-carboxylate reductase|uniref:pyrroline-5-carboxylate reductase n=1 Tax=Bacillaceae TaxID=186817 RepID=UPI0004E19F61|nr:MULTISPECIES: pyrroline-5-carboxylate reductase [Bacillaceae]MCF2649787.1 pyrroline-5-carboxylate reductase [Niallia circulans]CAI9388965.1 Pyrroline-5-carboxylate reductase [Bacillus sp. T2.9-1]
MNNLAIIGAGSMSEALISGIVSSKIIEPTAITVTNRGNVKRLTELQERYGIHYSFNLEKIIPEADVIILAMKPKDVKEAIAQWKDYLSEKTLLISVLAGVSMDSLQRLIGTEVPIARAMPNTSATVGKSATGISFNPFVVDEQKQFVHEMFETVGFVTFVEEEQLDAITGLSGSGPAYIYYLVEAMEKGGLTIGLDRDVANALIVQTLLGAAEMIAKSSKTPLELRKNVTSPGGTTEAGIRILEEFDVQKAFITCIQEATVQSKRMGKALTDDLKLPK